MEYIILEDLNLLLIHNGSDWEVQSVQINPIEMDCVEISGKYYHRGQMIDTNVQYLRPFQTKSDEFDHFDTEITCEEYYGG